MSSVLFHKKVNFGQFIFMVNYPFKLFCATWFWIFKNYYHIYLQFLYSYIITAYINSLCSSCSILLSLKTSMHPEDESSVHLMLKSCQYSLPTLLRRLLWWLGVLNYVISMAMSRPAVLGWKKHLANWGLPQSFYREEKIKNQPDALHCITSKYYF